MAFVTTTQNTIFEETNFTTTFTNDTIKYDIEEEPVFFNANVLLRFRFFIRYIIPLFCIVGVLGNSMALIILKTNYWLKRLTSNAYLTTLSIMGCLFLVILFVTFTESLLSFGSFYSTWPIGCKICTFLTHYSDFVCSWMIVWVSLDRMLILYRPKIRRYICNKQFAKTASCTTCLVGILIYCTFLKMVGIEETNGAVYCGLESSTDTIWGMDRMGVNNFFVILDMVVCTIIPSILIITVNCLSIYRYRQCMKVYASGILRVRFLKVPSGDTNGTQGTAGSNDTSNTRKTMLGTSLIGLSNQETCAGTNISKNRKSGKLRASDLTLTRSLLIVTSTFVFLGLPNYAFRIHLHYFGVEHGNHSYHFVGFLSNMIYYAHHAVLFYMYIFWSPQMKKQLKPTALKLLECYCCKTVPDFGHDNIPYAKR
uniref:G_PROTEIN_RECEP_F1_2 domain-containing protein n=1 Tax=Rhabditophanes sp. KR3021 TaxID=114890 RepID=A0AC35TLY1_9BILA